MFAARKALVFFDRHALRFGAVFILHILQKDLLVLGRIGYLTLRIDIHSLVPLSEGSQLPVRIKDMCRNQKHSLRWSHFSVVFGEHLFSEPHRENKSSFQGDIFLNTARITPSMWSNMSLCTVITWCNVTVCLFDIQRVLYQNPLNTSMTYFTMVHSSWVVNSGQYSVYFEFWSHSGVNSSNR